MITYMEGEKKLEIEEEVFIIIKEKMEEEENRVRIVAKEKECPKSRQNRTTPLFFTPIPILQPEQMPTPLDFVPPPSGTVNG